MNHEQPVKIAFITSEYPHERTPGICGGIGTSIMNLALELEKSVASVSVLIYGQDQDEAFEDGGISFYRIRNSTHKKIPWYFTQRKIGKLLNGLVSEGKVNIAEAPDWTGISAFANPKCPIVVRLHGSESYFARFSGLPIKWRVRFAEKMALKRADGLISVSRYTAGVTNQVFGLEKKFEIIPNGIATEYFNASETDDGKNPTLLYFGTLVRKKGSLELPLIFNKVIERNKECKLVLAGVDSNDPITGNPSVWRMMRELFSADALPNVNYVGSIPYSEIRNHIADAAVCVFPTFAEALPVSWIEAMAMRKAIVASDIGWAKEMIDDGKEGFLVHPSDHQKFADKILALLEHDTLRNSIALAAQQKAVSKFSIAVVAQQNIRFYSALIKR